MSSGATAWSPLGQLGKRVPVMEKQVVWLSLQVPGEVCVGKRRWGVTGGCCGPAALCPHLRTVGAH